MSEDHHYRERHFVETMGLFYSEMGGTPMMGRVLGRLLICAPPDQSLGELSEYLGASKGSVSTVTRQLLTSGLIEKVPRPGSREAVYRLRENAWVQIMTSRLAFTRMVREHAETGLALLADRPKADRRRMEEFVAFYKFFEDRFPAVADEWQAFRNQMLDSEE